MQCLLGTAGWCFRPGQRQVVDALLAGQDVLYVFPTGAGKSLCYQLPALLSAPGKFVLVISPLIALMEDQIQHLRARGVHAVAFHSERSPAERQKILAALGAERKATPRGQAAGGQTRGGNIAGKSENDARCAPKLIYLSPELACSPGFASTLTSWAPRIALVAVDEAHCVSKWGHDFRPSYRRLGELRGLLPPSVPWAACTATATAAVRRDVARNLGLQGSPLAEIVLPFDRPNLRYGVVRRGSTATFDLAGGPTASDSSCAQDELLKVILAQPEQDSGISYCQRQRDCERLAFLLQEQGVQALPYHAGLSRQAKQAAFLGFLGTSQPAPKGADNGAGEGKPGSQAAKQGMVRVLVATIAFGMGVDKPNVRFVVHAGPPRSLSAYYQESGRAGRDGLPALCLLYYAHEDVEALRRLLVMGSARDTGFGDSKEASLEVALRELEAVREYCEAKSCRRQLLLSHFGDQEPPVPKSTGPKWCCDVCAAAAGARLHGCAETKTRAAQGFQPAFRGFQPASVAFAAKPRAAPAAGGGAFTTFTTARQLMGEAAAPAARSASSEPDGKENQLPWSVFNRPVVGQEPGGKRRRRMLLQPGTG
ncbi:unnamed protein product [Polarella glacialis]|uniref:DNA 3'-5' helicase n=1 Tax=Polarella glacialis TaxID=89957 RepID=A0A813LQD6_POLGL|nr:unnamed protein product [Polarella glacialis]